ncbi:glutathione peroxidase, partial [Chrysochromulina tobinii]
MRFAVLIFVGVATTAGHDPVSSLATRRVALARAAAVAGTGLWRSAVLAEDSAAAAATNLLVNVKFDDPETLDQMPAIGDMVSRYSERGLHVLAFPTDQGWFEADDSNTLRLKYKSVYGFGQYPTAVVFDKTDLLGGNALPLYTWMTTTLSNPWGVNRLVFNYEKFLVDDRGQPRRRYPRKFPIQLMDADVQALLNGQPLPPPSASLEKAWEDAKREAVKSEYSFKPGLGKKKQFIDRTAESTAHFQIVHRSQRDPLAADPDAPQRVLLPTEIGQRKGTSDRASQSTRAWLEEQDLAGFEALTGRPTPGRRSEDFADFAVAPNDDYDYGQHLLPIKGDGVFIPRTELLGPSGGGSSAGGRGSRSVAGSSASRLSRLSRASITLRNVAGVSEAFASAEELAVAVGGASNGLDEEEEESLVRAEMGEELWALLQTDGPKDASILEEEEEEGGEGADGVERPNEDEDELEDDFVIKAALPIVPSRRRRPKRQQQLPKGSATVRPEGEEGEEGEE